MPLFWPGRGTSLIGQSSSAPRFFCPVCAALLLLYPGWAAAEVRPLSERIFWIGSAEEAKRWPDDRIFLTRIKWMRPILWNDPALWRKTVIFSRRYYDVA